MWPVLVDTEILGFPIKIYAFGTFIVLAFLAASFYVRSRAHRELGLDKERVFNVCFALLFIGLAGARLLYALVHYDEFTSTPLKFIRIWEGGLVYYGGLFACLLWLCYYLPRHAELKGWAFTDILALGAALAIFVGRWASFLSGENYGEIAPDLPWAVTFPLGDAHGASLADPRGVPLHPTQLYHGLHGLLLFAILWLYMRRKPFPGRATGLFLSLYALGRAIIEIWRADDVARGMVIDDVLSTGQLLSVPVFFLGLAITLIRRPPSDASYATART